MKENVAQALRETDLMDANVLNSTETR